MTGRNRMARHLLRLAGTLALINATLAQASDLLLVNGRIYTAGEEKWAEAIAITGETIDAVGTTAHVMKNRTDATRVIDLGGRMVIPGITDDHVHIWFGSLALNNINLSTPERNITPEQDRDLFVAKIREYSAQNPGLPILFGRAAFSRGTPDPGPGLALLDEAVPDRPIIIHHTSEHALWVNSKALELAGITDAPLPNPQEEMYVERDANGRPTGLLREAAMDVMERNLPRMPMEDQVRILAEGQRYLNSFGVTSGVALTGGLQDLEAYAEMRRRGQLTMRVRQGFASVSVNHELTPEFLANLEKARTTYDDDWLSANIVKFFMDGAPTPPLYEASTYTNIITELDRRGFQITSHALSPDGVRMALDGYKSVIATNGQRDRRFRIEHGSRFVEEDLPRFAELDVAVSTQPAFCCSPDTPSNPWKSLLDSGANLVFSSDWPCSWPPSPMEGIEQAAMRYVRQTVTAEGPQGTRSSDNMPQERVGVEDALLAYTRNAAIANHTDDKLGTLAAGKLADLVVLSQNILEVPVEQVGETQVVATMVGGKVVHGALQ